MRVFLDMDGVLVNFSGGIAKKFGLELDVNHWPVDLLGVWDWFEHFGLTWKQVAAVCTAQFWQDLEWMPDGRIILACIEKLYGKDIYLLTMPMRNPQSITGKMLWVQKNMPEYANKVIACSDGIPKEIFLGAGRLLVDDGDHNVTCELAAAGQGVLIPRPWNRLHSLCTSGLASNMGAYLWATLKEND